MQLTYPWFLAGLLAVAIPVVIHLLQLRRPQRIQFTNTSFIREVELITVRQRKLQHLLVLLARVLGVAALVLMFCQPFIPAPENSRPTGAGSLEVVVDTSPSMQREAKAGGTLLTDAVADARNLGTAHGATARFRLLNQGRATLTPVAYQARLEELRVNAQSAPLNRLTKAADGNGLQSSPLYLISDFQRSGFNPKAIADLGTSREVILVPKEGRPAGNIYVDSVWLDDAFVRQRTNVGLHIRFRNGGTQAVADCPIKVYLGERQVAAFQTSVAPGQAAATVVQVQVNDDKLALGRVVSSDVPVTFDNTYYFTLQPTPAIPVLEIGDEPVAQQLYRNEPLFSYTFSRPQALDYGVLRKANLVLVREAAAVEAGLREGLQAVVKRGGSVVIVPPAASSGHSSYQELFRKLGLGAVQWEKAPAGAPELREVAMPSAREPFFRDVFGQQQRAVTMPRVAPVLRWPRTGTDIMRLRDGESYVAEFASGAGRVYVFSAPFAKAYSDFTSHALFVPVLYRMAMLSYRNDQLPAYRLTQSTLTLDLPVASAAAPESGDAASIRFVKDSVVLIPSQRLQGQEARLDIPAGLNVPGFYQVQRRGTTLTTLAFNQDKRESELAAYSADELRQQLGPNQKNVRVLDDTANGTTLAKFRAEQQGQPLWRYFLVLALLCLLAETLLLRFGQQKPAVSARAAVPA